MMPTLIVTFMSGPEDGKTNVIPLDGNNAVATIGRLDECTISIPYDPDASRKHAQLSSRNGEWWLNDLGSANGTFIDEFAQSRKLTAAEKILPGQIFRVGLTRFKLEKEDTRVNQAMSAIQTI
jgi:pSer/pThr/pTyr-binding forkhead associated (FHA) protein